MPPRKFSRHLFTYGFKDPDDEDADDVIQLTEREPFTFKNYPDNRIHTVVEGDTLHHLAARYFAPIDNPASLWWVIADFQPEPIDDPTIRLRLGSTLVIPSVRTVLEAVFSEERRRESSA